MSFEFVRKLPTPEEIRRDYPVPEQIVRLKEDATGRSATYLPEKAINFLSSSAPALRTTRTPSATMFPALPGSMKK